MDTAAGTGLTGVATEPVVLKTEDRPGRGTGVHRRECQCRLNQIEIAGLLVLVGHPVAVEAEDQSW